MQPITNSYLNSFYKYRIVYNTKKHRNVCIISTKSLNSKVDVPSDAICSATFLESRNISTI